MLWLSPLRDKCFVLTPSPVRYSLHTSGQICRKLLGRSSGAVSDLSPQLGDLALQRPRLVDDRTLRLAQLLLLLRQARLAPAHVSWRQPHRADARAADSGTRSIMRE
jgi:hypothetical protein